MCDAGLIDFNRLNAALRMLDKLNKVGDGFPPLTKPNTVFVVMWYNEDEDYDYGGDVPTIQGIFSTEERAKEFVSLYHKYSNECTTIEAWELDTLGPPMSGTS
jgi:hypothetical protein